MDTREAGHKPLYVCQCHVSHWYLHACLCSSGLSDALPHRSLSALNCTPGMAWWCFHKACGSVTHSAQSACCQSLSLRHFPPWLTGAVVDSSLLFLTKTANRHIETRHACRRVVVLTLLLGTTPLQPCPSPDPSHLAQNVLSLHLLQWTWSWACGTSAAMTQSAGLTAHQPCLCQPMPGSKAKSSMLLSPSHVIQLNMRQR